MDPTSTASSPEYRAGAEQTRCDDTPLPAEALSSVVLLQGNSSIAINHLGTRYVLRATRAGKLILTK
jgi:hemin uptake protein HemP